MKKFFLMVFLLVEIVIGFQIFTGGIPTWASSYIGLLVLIFVIFNLILLAAFFE